MTGLRDLLEEGLADRYHLLREVGEGGMATVFLASDIRHHRAVAIKVLKPDLALFLGTQRFLSEIAIAARLNHPHILPLLDSGSVRVGHLAHFSDTPSSELLYYVMPYVEGNSLRDRLSREGRLPPEEALRITGEIADALEYAHRQGLIHRDIKPENVLFQAGHALLSDFGIARAVSEAGDTRLTQTGLAVGTPSYMSPEQAMGSPNLDARADLYSLGCVLFEMLTGVVPFRGNTPQAIAAGHAAAPVPALRSLGVSIPAATEAAAVKALAKDPEDRFFSARAFADALRGPSSASAGVRRHVRERSRAYLALGVVVISVLAWMARKEIMTGRATPMSSLAVLPFTDRTGDSSQAFFVAGVHESVIDELSRIASLRVVPRRSTLAYEGTRKTVAQIATELGVEGVVEGSVFRSGDSVRIDVQLIQARPDERQVWAEAFDRDLPHVLSAYTDVAKAIASRVEAQLTPAEEARLASTRKVDPASYDSYLKGRFHSYKLTPEDLDAAEQYFLLALRQDSLNALGHVGLSTVWISRLQMGFAPPEEATPRSKSEALRALAMDSTLLEGHHNLALIAIQSDWDWARADSEFRLAIALNPGFADAHAFYSHLLNIVGRPREARQHMDRALAIDPLNPLFLALDAVDLLFERRWSDADRQARRALETEPGHPVALSALWAANDVRGRHSDAAGAAERYLRAIGQDQAAAAVMPSFRAKGYPAAMRRAADILAKNSKTRHVTLWDIGNLYCAAGDAARAMDWYERGYAAHDPNVPYLGLPTCPLLQSEARFHALLKKAMLPPNAISH